MPESYVKALLPDDLNRWNYGSALGTPVSLTYGFMTRLPLYADPQVDIFGKATNPYWLVQNAPPFAAFDAAQRAAADSVLARFSDVTNVSFTFNANGDAAQLRYGGSELDTGVRALGYLPVNQAGVDLLRSQLAAQTGLSFTPDWNPVLLDVAGDVWVSVDEPARFQTSPGQTGFWMLLHETGHALGLDHPFFEDPGDQPLPQAEDNHRYTVMSYNPAPGMTDVEPSTLMLYDIATLQYLYGANFGTRAGDTVYTWTNGQRFLQTIWDGGGNDTIDLSNWTSAVTVDLRGGTNFGSVGGDRNLAIAFGATIENAKGGSGNDTLIGNAAANVLSGGTGNDSLSGAGGNDTLLGGDGDDVLIGGAGADTLNGGNGVDTVSYAGLARVSVDLSTGTNTGDAAGDVFVGIEKIIGSSEADTLIGDSGSNWLVGGGGDDILDGGGGADRLEGSALWSAQVTYAHSAAAVDVSLAAGTGHGGDAEGDVLIGIREITGSAFDDHLVGNGLRNTLRGGAGNDVLESHGGNESLFGGAGDDTYIIEAGDFASESGGSGNDEVRTIGNITSALPFGFERITFIGTGNAELWGGDDNNIVTGGAGDDVLVGAGGADTLIGGAGFDTARYTGVISGVSVDLATGQSHGADAEGDTLVNIEGLVGTTFGDTFAGDDGANSLDGLGGNDVLNGRGGDDTITGGAGNDTIDGGDGSDVAVFIGTAREYAVSTVDDVTTVTALRTRLAGLEGVDTLRNVEQFRFTGQVANRAPAVFASSSRYQSGTPYRLNAIVTTGDSDGDQIKGWEFRDTTAGSGTLVRGGVTAGLGDVVSAASAADLAGITFTLDGGTGTFEGRAFDGVDWGDWRTVTVKRVNQVPTVTVNAVVMSRMSRAVSLSSLIAATTDADSDPITAYEFDDLGNDGGVLELGGVAQAQGATVQVNAADLANARFRVASSTVDTILIRVFDGIDWSESRLAQISTITKNVVPTVSASNFTVAHNLRSVAASSLFSVGDADGDPATEYEFWDGGTAETGGHFETNGVVQAPNRGFVLDAAQLGQVAYRVGSTPETLWVRAFDGLGWSAWSAGFTVAPGPNQLPTIAVANVSPSHSTTTLAAADLFAVTDADNDTIAQYELWDGNAAANSGRFELNGVKQAAGSGFVVDSTQLSQTTFRVGSTADLVWVRAFDGFDWSAWQNFTINAPANAAPAVTVPAAPLTPTHGTTTIAAADLFSASDADGDAITRYELWDSGIEATSGRFEVGAAPQTAGGSILIDPAQLAQTVFRLGATSDLLWARAFDGTDWGDWKSFTVTPATNAAPTATIPVANITLAHGTTTVGASTLFNVSDADGDAITKYEFWDGNDASDSGHFEVGGVKQAAGSGFVVDPTQLAHTVFRVGSTPDTLWVRAFDGSAWSAWSNAFTVTPPVNNAPTVTLTSTNVTPTRGTTTIAAGTLFSASDPDGDTIAEYEFWDGDNASGSGHFAVSGIGQTAGRGFVIDASQLGQTDFRLGTTADTLWVRAFDGTAWSGWSSAFVVNPPTDHAPTVTAASFAASQRTVAAAALFSAVDDEGDAITQYEFWDSGFEATSGHFELSGAPQTPGHAIAVSAADLANTTFRLGPTSDLLWVRAYDGSTWGDWKSFTLTPPNQAPNVLVAGASVVPGAAGSTVAARTLFSASDSDGDSIVRYELWDVGTEATSGRFEVNGLAQGANRAISVSAAEFQSTIFRLGTTSDVIRARAFDGATWSDLQSLTVSPAGNQVAAITSGFNAAPIVSVENVAMGADSLPLASLVSGLDPESSTIQRWQISDDTADAGSGSFIIGGLAHPEQRLVDVTPAELLTTRFGGGDVGATDQLRARAFDGFGWSAWQSFTVTRADDTAPVVRASDFALSTPGDGVAASSLFRVDDADGDAITRYQIWNWTTAGSGGDFHSSSEDRPVNQLLDLTAAEFASLRYTPADAGNYIEVRAFDGTSWSEWQGFTLVSPFTTDPSVRVTLTQGPLILHDADYTFTVGLNVITPTPGPSTVTSGVVITNAQPSVLTVTVANLAPPAGTTALTASQLFTLKNSLLLMDGSSMELAIPGDTVLALHRHGSVLTGGHFELNGVALPINGAFNVRADELDGLRYIPGSSGDLVDISAGGTGWKSFAIFAPSDATPDVLIQAPDLVRLDTNIDVPALSIESPRIVLADGIDLGTTALSLGNFIPPAPNVAPVVTALTPPALSSAAIPVASLFGVSDTNGDIATSYRVALWSSSTGGHLTFNGSTLPINTESALTPYDLARLQYVPGTTGDIIELQAFDGHAWSNWSNQVLVGREASPPAMIVETSGNVTLHSARIVIPGNASFTVNVGGTVEFDGALNTGTGPVTISSTTIINGGNVTLGGGTNSGSSGITLNGTTAGSGGAVTLGSGGTISDTGALSPVSAFTVTAAGLLATEAWRTGLSGTAAGLLASGTVDDPMRQLTTLASG